jgi:hypothetical protein
MGLGKLVRKFNNAVLNTVVKKTVSKAPVEVRAQAQQQFNTAMAHPTFQKGLKRVNTIGTITLASAVILGAGAAVAGAGAGAAGGGAAAGGGGAAAGAGAGGLKIGGLVSAAGGALMKKNSAGQPENITTPTSSTSPVPTSAGSDFIAPAALVLGGLIVKKLIGS